MKRTLALLLLLAPPAYAAPPAMLTVEVEQTMNAGGSSSRIGISDGSVVISTRPELNSATAKGGFEASTRRSSTDQRQMLRVMDGKSAYIALSSERPLPWLMLRPDGSTVAASQQAVSGFEVTPRRRGQNVELDIAVRQQRFDGAAVSGQQLRTTVAGALGQWIELGSISSDKQGNEQLLLGGSSQQGRQHSSVRVRVTPATNP